MGFTTKQKNADHRQATSTRLLGTLGVLAIGLFAACLAASQAEAQQVVEIDPDRVDPFIEVFAQNECRITEAEGDMLFAANGYADIDEVRAIMARLFYHGRARLATSGDQIEMLVYGGPCPAGDETSDVKTLFLTLVAQQGCALGIGAARPLLAEAGISLQEVRMMMPLLVNDGTVTVSADETSLTLEDEACHHYAPTVQASDLGHDPLDDPRAALIAYLENTGCIISYDDAQEKLPEAGFDFDALDKLIPDYVEEGIMAIGPDETLILTTGECA